MEVFDGKLVSFIAEMIEEMIFQNGIGLAAPQVGVSERIIVYLKQDYEGVFEPKYMINPEIVESQGEYSLIEGCLSLPNVKKEVKRKNKISVRYQDIKGRIRKEELSELNAIVIQHEIDHLDGKLMTDY